MNIGQWFWRSFKYLGDPLNTTPKGKCIYCGEMTEETNVIADDVDEEGNVTGCREFCCNNCYENMKDKI